VLDNFAVFHAENIRNSLTTIVFTIGRVNMQPYQITVGCTANDARF